MLRYILALLLLSAFTGCDGGIDFPIPRAPGGQTPVAGAIEYRGPNNEDLGVIGVGPTGGFIQTGPLPDSVPSECDPDSEVACEAVPSLDFRLAGPYPNPTNGFSTLSIAFAQPTEATIFVVAALPPGNTSPPPADNAQGAWVYRPGGYPVAILARQPFGVGTQQILFDFADVAGRPLPSGYYRIYIQTSYFIAWRDVLYDPSSDLFF